MSVEVPLYKLETALENIIAVTGNGEIPNPIVAQNGRKVPPNLSDLLDHRKQECKNEINCMLIGTIKTFYPDNQTADITINIWRVLKQSRAVAENQTADTYVKYPVLINCPVVVLSGGGSMITFPIASGDTCLVFFADRDIDTWFESGQVTIPNSDRVHDLNDGIALVGVNSLINSLSLYSSDTIEIRRRDGLPYYDKPIVNIGGAVGMAQMIVPPTNPVPGCFYWNPVLNNWYGWKIVAWTTDPIPLPIYGWVAFT